MSKTVYFVIFVLVGSILIFFALSTYIYNGQQVEEIDSQYLENMRAENTLKNCMVDADCVIFQPDCEDCTFDAVSASKLTELEQQRNTYCELNPPQTQCDSIFTGRVACIENLCRIVTE